MEIEKEEEVLFAPASPGAQYLNSSALSLTVMAVMESQVPIDESLIIPHIGDKLVPLNYRFSSIMVTGKNGLKYWKKVNIIIKDHFIIPKFPNGKPTEFYDEQFTEYISNLAIEKLPENKPLWEMHLFKYPTSNNAAGTIIFKIHHSLGDGYTLMGVTLSGLQRVDNPELPLTFPSRDLNPKSRVSSTKSCFANAGQYCKQVKFTVTDFGWGILKSKFIKDDRTPIRSGDDGVEFQPVVLTTMVFSLDSIKQIKDKLKVTINDVITGAIMMGTRLYMQGENPKSSQANCTSLVLLNTRAIGGYTSVNEMIKPDSQLPSGNNFAFLHIPVPKLPTSENTNPIDFIWKARKIIKQKRNSASVYLTGKMLDTVRRLRGPEATAKYIHGTLKNSSMTISNMIGPVNQMALATHPINGFYFFVAGAPQSLAILIMSYMGNLRVAIAVEKGFIDPNKFKSCIDKAFQMIFKEALG